MHKLPKYVSENFKIARKNDFKIFKNLKSGLSEKLLELNMWLVVNHTKPTNTLCCWQLPNNSVNGAIMIKTISVIRNRDNLGKLREKPQMTDRDKWKVIESLQLHILHQRRLYSIVNVVRVQLCYLRVFGALGNFGKLAPSVLNSLEFFNLTFLLHEV